MPDDLDRLLLRRPVLPRDHRQADDPDRAEPQGVVALLRSHEAARVGVERRVVAVELAGVGCDRDLQRVDQDLAALGEVAAAAELDRVATPDRSARRGGTLAARVLAL